MYLLSNSNDRVLYIGVTNDLIRRIWEHKQDLIEGFTKKYKVHKLVYYEEFSDPESAVRREKCIKKWNRKWKDKLINKMNPKWNDLYKDLL